MYWLTNSGVDLLLLGHHDQEHGVQVYITRLRQRVITGSPARIIQYSELANGITIVHS